MFTNSFRVRLSNILDSRLEIEQHEPPLGGFPTIQLAVP